MVAIVYGTMWMLEKCLRTSFLCAHKNWSFRSNFWLQLERLCWLIACGVGEQDWEFTDSSTVLTEEFIFVRWQTCYWKKNLGARLSAWNLTSCFLCLLRDVRRNLVWGSWVGLKTLSCFGSRWRFRRALRVLLQTGSHATFPSVHYLE